MASAQPDEPSRPETDYERWLRGKDENYRPGVEPVYGPGDSAGGERSISSGFFMGYSKTFSIILAVLLLTLVIRAFRKRRSRGV
jgi:hypothetical protein